MAIAIVVTDRDVSVLQQKVQAYLNLPTIVWAYPDIAAYEEIEMAVLWKQPTDILSRFPRLKLVSSLGAGVEHILADPALPEQVAISRIVDDSLTQAMRNYVLMAVMNIHKQFRFYQKNQLQQQWIKPQLIEQPLKIGILGLGALGSAIGQSLTSLGFDVFGYSQFPKNISGINCLNAQQMPIQEFVSLVNLLVCLLPRTSATEGILNYPLFKKMQPGSFLINVARGIHLIEPDLIRAIDEGIISEAYLDVFQEEPLPSGHPFWNHPNIVITPHIASITNQEKAAKIIAENYQRMKSGQPLLFEVDRTKGY